MGQILMMTRSMPGNSERGEGKNLRELRGQVFQAVQGKKMRSNWRAKVMHWKLCCLNINMHSSTLFSRGTFVLHYNPESHITEIVFKESLKKDASNRAPCQACFRKVEFKRHNVRCKCRVACIVSTS